MIHVVKNERDVVILTCNRATYRIPGIPADDYPLVADQGDLPFYKVKGGILKELIRKTAFAISTDEMRKNLCGVLMETEKTGDSFSIRMVATDGHRLAMMKVDTGEKDFLRWRRGASRRSRGDPASCRDNPGMYFWGSAGCVS
jgi:DNA polymerase-3 subunit beta